MQEIMNVRFCLSLRGVKSWRCQDFLYHAMSVVRAFFDSFGLFRLRQNNWRIVLTKKIARKSRNSRRFRGGKVGAEGMVTMLCCPGTKYKPSKDAFAFTCIVIILVPLGTKLLEIFAQFLIGSPGTSLYLRIPAALRSGAKVREGVQ